MVRAREGKRGGKKQEGWGSDRGKSEMQGGGGGLRKPLQEHLIKNLNYSLVVVCLFVLCVFSGEI